MQHRRQAPTDRVTFGYRAKELPKRIAVVERSLVWLCAICFYWLLDTFYTTNLDTAYGTYFAASEIGLPQKICFSMLAALPSLWLPLKIDRPSRFALWGLFFVMFVPVASIFPHMLDRPTPQVFGWISGYSAAMAVLQYITTISLKPFPRFAIKSATFWGIILFILAAIEVSIALQVGFRWGFTSFTEVYDLRSLAATQHSKLSSYLYGWLANGFNLIVFIRAMQSKKPHWIGIAFFSTVFTYSVEGGKHSLFLLLLALFAWLLLSTRTRYPAAWVAVFFLFSGIAAYCTESFWEGDFDFSLFLLRRVFVVPASISAKYIEFFSDNPPTLMGDGLLRYFVRYPYEVSTPELIANYFFETGSSANTGFIASGFAQFGFLGAIFSTLVVGFILRLLDSAGLEQELRLSASFSAVVILALTNSPVTVSLLTHGIGVSLLLLYAYPRNYPKTCSQSQTE